MKNFETISELEVLYHCYFSLFDKYNNIYNDLKKYGYNERNVKKFEKIQNQLREINQKIIDIEENELEKINKGEKLL